MIIHADYLMDAGVLKVIKKSDGFEFTNPGILKLPLEDIYRGGNSKSRNPHMQTMLRIEALEEHGTVTPKEAERVCGKSPATIRRYLGLLNATGLVVAEGSTNNSVYKTII